MCGTERLSCPAVGVVIGVPCFCCAPGNRRDGTGTSGNMAVETGQMFAF